MYLDRHDAPGVTAEELAEAHRLDTEIQEKHGVRFNTYWFDPDRGTVFCLAEGPSERAVVAVHEEAHGQLPSAVIELDPAAPLNALLGPLPTHPVGTAYSEPAMRAIVFTDIRGSSPRQSNWGTTVTWPCSVPITTSSGVRWSSTPGAR